MVKKSLTKKKQDKKPVGRPLKYESPKEMQADIDLYFKRCDTNFVQVYDKIKQSVVEMKKPIPYTIEGLCATLAIDRKTLLNYQNKDEYFHTIKKAKEEVLQNQVEAALTNQSNSTLTIFLLKNNNDYKDKSEVATTIEHIGKVKRTYVHSKGD